MYLIYFFVDDSFFFMEFDDHHVQRFKWLLDEYRYLAGQKVNFSKSEIVVSPNFKADKRDFLPMTLGVKIVEKPGVYLGADLDFTRRKGELFKKNSGQI